jgi:hypothetical protein
MHVFLVNKLSLQDIVPYLRGNVFVLLECHIKISGACLFPRVTILGRKLYILTT